MITGLYCAGIGTGATEPADGFMSWAVATADPMVQEINTARRTHNQQRFIFAPLLFWFVKPLNLGTLLALSAAGVV
jgi:hypothetical protein